MFLMLKMLSVTCIFNETGKLKLFSRHNAQVKIIYKCTNHEVTTPPINYS